jgi:UDP-2,3-diacylglucosamine pyrophosphatase LpxH
MIAFITDLHFGYKNFDKNLFHYQLEFFTKQFFPYLLQNNIKDVVIPGDIVDNRTVMDIYIQQKLDEEFFGFFEKNGITLNYLIGNHDLYLRQSNEISYAYTLQKYKSVHIIDKVQTLIVDGVDIGFIPWGMESEMDKISNDVSILVGHFETGGVLKNNSETSSGKLKVSDFQYYKCVLSGHYHGMSLNNNLRYLGSPYPMDRNDFGLKKGFWVYKNGFLHLEENKISPKFIKVNYTEDGKDLKIIIDDGITKEEFTNATIALKSIGENFTDIFIEKYVNEALLDKFLGDIKNNRSQTNYEIFAEIDKQIVDMENDIGLKTVCTDYISQLNFEEIYDKDYVKKRFGHYYDVADNAIGVIR